MARKQEAMVAERDGRRREDLLRLSMDHSGWLWLQDRRVLPTLNSVSSGTALAEKLAGPLGMGATQDPTSCSKCVWKLREAGLRHIQSLF